MQQEIKAIVDTPEEKSQKPWHITVPKEPVRESIKWHMQHKPYQGGNKCGTYTKQTRE